MIVRILADGRYIIAGPGPWRAPQPRRLAGLRRRVRDEATFSAALQALQGAVRRLGTPVPRGTPMASDLVLPRRTRAWRGARPAGTNPEWPARQAGCRWGCLPVLGSWRSCRCRVRPPSPFSRGGCCD